MSTRTVQYASAFVCIASTTVMTKPKQYCPDIKWQKKDSVCAQAQHAFGQAIWPL